MADITITAASVVRGPTAKLETGTAGATITQGQPVYRDATDGLYKLSDCNSATAAVRAVRGIALNAASTGQPLTIAKSGPVTIGATLVAGVAYYLSGTAGGICPVADLTTGDYPTVLGIATSTTVLNVDIQSSGAILL
tara:strand:- start:454 stop:867 length:414 start_codon:yes stop_codon:yes gene_type:complete